MPILASLFFFLFISVAQIFAASSIPPSQDPPVAADCPQELPDGITCVGLVTKSCIRSGCQIYVCKQSSGNLLCDPPQASSVVCPPLAVCLYSQPCPAGDATCKVYTCASGDVISDWVKTDYLCIPAKKPTPTPIGPSPAPPRLPCSSGWDKNNHLTTNRNDIVSCHTVATGLGTIGTDQQSFIKSLFGIILSISGGIALLLIIYGGYQLMTSRGKPEAMDAARDQITAAIIGLLLIIFSLVLLQVIGYDILRIPGFAP